jgi:hypothetical protein
MEYIRGIKRFVARWGLDYPPQYQEVEVRLMRGNARPEGVYCIITPWACLGANIDATDQELISALGTSFETADEALAHAKRKAPFAGTPANEAIRDQVFNARYHYGPLVGTYRVADKHSVSYDAILAIARGEIKAPKIKREKKIV